jgi:group I intron endonuclease
MFVYVIVNQVNGKYYIGKTRNRDLQQYWRLQKRSIFRSDKPSTAKPYLYNAVRKYGWDKFSIYPLISNVQSDEKLFELEKLLVEMLGAQKHGYNLCAGGRGVTPTAEIQDKLRRARANQDEIHRLKGYRKFEAEHGAERRKRAAVTHTGMKHRMSPAGHTAISEAFKKSSAKRWSTHSLVGQIFERLTVESEVGRNKRGLIQWNCQCSCGGTTIATTTLLRTGHKKSCGCLAKELALDNLRVLNSR